MHLIGLDYKKVSKHIQSGPFKGMVHGAPIQRKLSSSAVVQVRRSCQGTGAPLRNLASGTVWHFLLAGGRLDLSTPKQVISKDCMLKILSTVNPK